MIIMKTINQPFGPSYGRYGDIRINNPGAPYRPPLMQMAGYGRMRKMSPSMGVFIANPGAPFRPPLMKMAGFRGFGEDDGGVDWSTLIPSLVQGTATTVAAAAPVAAKLITGSQQTGTQTVPVGSTGGMTGTAGASAIKSNSFFSSIPTTVWVVGGLAVAGGLAVLLLK